MTDTGKLLRRKLSEEIMQLDFNNTDVDNIQEN
jgi:hypothetical protein